jgi:Na+-transporting methylmalonyl-CoA/oxaloacetate decarboxylase gamma subunit
MTWVSFDPGFVPNNWERELSDQDEVGDHEEQSNGKALEPCDKGGRFLVGGRGMVLVVVVLVLLVVVVIVVSDWLGEDGAIDTLHIVLVLEGRPGEEASEAKDISKEFQRVGKFFDGIMLAQLIDLGGGEQSRGQQM